MRQAQIGPFPTNATLNKERTGGYPYFAMLAGLEPRTEATLTAISTDTPLPGTAWVVESIAIRYFISYTAIYGSVESAAERAAFVAALVQAEEAAAHLKIAQERTAAGSVQEQEIAAYRNTALEQVQKLKMEYEQRRRAAAIDGLKNNKGGLSYTLALAPSNGRPIFATVPQQESRFVGPITFGALSETPTVENLEAFDLDVRISDTLVAQLLSPIVVRPGDNITATWNFTRPTPEPKGTSTNSYSGANAVLVAVPEMYMNYEIQEETY